MTAANPATRSPGVTIQNVSLATYQTVAASQTDVALTTRGGGFKGDYLQGILIIPATTSAGNVSLKDGAGSSISIFVTGTLSNLTPIFVPILANSMVGGWTVTTGPAVSVVATGTF